jgi:hypothetical protein
MKKMLLLVCLGAGLAVMAYADPPGPLGHPGAVGDAAVSWVQALLLALGWAL